MLLFDREARSPHRLHGGIERPNAFQPNCSASDEHSILVAEDP